MLFSRSKRGSGHQREITGDNFCSEEAERASVGACRVGARRKLKGFRGSRKRLSKKKLGGPQRELGGAQGDFWRSWGQYKAGGITGVCRFLDGPGRGPKVTMSRKEASRPKAGEWVGCRWTDGYTLYTIEMYVHTEQKLSPCSTGHRLLRGSWPEAPFYMIALRNS